MATIGHLWTQMDSSGHKWPKWTDVDTSGQQQKSTQMDMCMILDTGGHFLTVVDTIGQKWTLRALELGTMRFWEHVNSGE